MVSGGRLRFRDGARLPTIDLHTGSSEVELTPAAFEFRAVSPLASAIARWGWVPLVVGAILFVDGIRGYALPLFIFGFSVLWSVVARMITRVRSEGARLHWYVDTGREEGRRRWVKWANRIFFAAFGFLMTCAFLDWMDWFPLAILLFVVGLVVLVISQRRVLVLRCTGAREGWFEIHGIPDAALAVLGRLQVEAAREAMEGGGRVRLRKVFTIYLHRFSLPVLVGRAMWNPVVLSMVLAMKWGRSRLLERDSFALTEADDLATGEWDPRLRERWDEVGKVDRLQGWRLLHARRLDSPMGDLLTQWFTLTCPRGRHGVTLSVVRVANARASKEVMEVSVRSWTEEGMLCLTTNLRLQKPLPPSVALKRVRGSLEKVVAAHLERVEGLSLIALDSPAAWEERLDRDAEERHAALEQAGIYGPTREEEFPDPG